MTWTCWRHGAMIGSVAGARRPRWARSCARRPGAVGAAGQAGRELLAGLARLVPLLPGACISCVRGHRLDAAAGLRAEKQGAAFGHTKISGKTVLVRGPNALAATVSTPQAAPVIAGTRLRGGSVSIAAGAVVFAAEAIGAARACGCTGQIVARMARLRQRCGVPGGAPRRGVLLLRPPGWIPRSRPRSPRQPQLRVDGHQDRGDPG